LHIVTGKGGTGKTTVACALAVALASEGKKVLLCEVEGRQGVASMFGHPSLPYAETMIAELPDGGQVYALAVEPKAALLEYLELFYHLGRAGSMLERMGAINFATTVAPGLRDVLLTGKVYEAVRRRRDPAAGSARNSTRDNNSVRDSNSARDSAPVYDAVVLDAPPTGRIGRFLNVNHEVADLAKVGPIRNQAESIMTLLRGPQTMVHVVTLLEEMPVQESLDAVTELTALGLPMGAIIINAAERPVLDAADLDLINGLTDGPAADAEFGADAGLRAAGLDPEVATSLLDQARNHSQRLRLEDALRQRLAASGSALCELPALTDGAGLAALPDLAGSIIEQLSERNLV
jgi:anion-transporting  ArsA/GET3 family ATPase